MLSSITASATAAASISSRPVNEDARASRAARTTIIELISTNSGSLSTDTDHANRLGQEQQHRQAGECRRATHRGSYQTIEQNNGKEKEENPEQMHAVGSRSHQHLHESEQVQVARRPSRIERQHQVRALQRNAERQVAKPEAAFDEILLVAEEAAERHLRVIGQQEEAGHCYETQRHRGDEHPRHSPALDRIQAARGVADDRHDRDREPDRQRRQRVDDTDRDARQRRTTQRLRRQGECGPPVHASASVRTRSYARATDSVR